MTEVTGIGNVLREKEVCGLMGGRPGRGNVYVGTEVLRDWNSRIFREGRYKEYERRLAQVRRDTGLSTKEARLQLLEEFGPGTVTTAKPNETRVALSAGSVGEAGGGTFLDAVNWAYGALGLAESKRPSETAAPSPVAWRLYWDAIREEKRADDLRGLWIKLNARAVDRSGDDEAKYEARRQIEDVVAMLGECSREASSMVEAL